MAVSFLLPQKSLIMVNNIKILDCTLRDGGYYTNWDFDSNFVDGYLEAMDSLPIDYVEIGYISKELGGYYGKYFYLSKDTILECKGKLKETKISIMLDYKNCDIDYLQLKLPALVGYVDLVRLAVNPAQLSNTRGIIKLIKDFGFEVAVNLMYLSRTNIDAEFIDTVADLSSNIDMLYLVDSFGSCEPSEIHEKISQLREKTNLQIGFHGHNNIELAFSNTISAINSGADIVDCTVMGMGRGAGNLKTELLLAYMHSKGIKNNDLNSLSNLVSLMNPLYKQHQWGSNFPYIVSGVLDLPQKNVMEWLSTNRYSANTIVKALLSSQKKVSESVKVYKDTFEFKEAIIIGGGESVSTHYQQIKKFILNKTDIVIIYSSMKYLLNFDNNTQAFLCLSGSELEKIPESKHKAITDNHITLVLPPSPRKMPIKIPDHLIECVTELKSPLYFQDLIDSPLAIALSVALVNKTCLSIYLVGFDGYQNANEGEQHLNMENQKIIDISLANNKDKKIISLTKTRYKNLLQESIYAKEI